MFHLYGIHFVEGFLFFYFGKYICNFENINTWIVDLVFLLVGLGGASAFLFLLMEQGNFREEILLGSFFLVSDRTAKVVPL